MDHPFRSAAEVFRPSSRLRALRLGLVVVVVVCGLLLLAAPGHGYGTPQPGSVLTSSTDFSISGDVANLTPGLTASLNVTVNNPQSVPITLTSVTVTVSPTSTMPVVPPNCPGSDLSLQFQSTSASFTGSPAQAVLTIPAPQPVIGAGASEQIPALTILLARSAGNECQNVTFPLNYAATATSNVATTTTAPPTSPPAATAPATPAPTSAPSSPTSPATTLAPTGAQIAELVVGGGALVLIGVISIVAARRRRREGPA